VSVHFLALVPCQGASQLLRQLADVLGKRATTLVVSLRASLTSIVKRLWRSTSVAMWVSFAPVSLTESESRGLTV